MYNLACSYAQMDRNDEALIMLQDSFEMRQRILPADHPDIGNEIIIDQLCILTRFLLVLAGDCMMAIGTITCSTGRFSDDVSMLK
jgi:hypothetical protein